MPFLQRHRCRIDFSKYAMLMGDRELACVDKFGRLLAGGVQVVRSCTIPGHSRATIHCKVDNGYLSRLKVVESTHARIQPARNLNRLTGRKTKRTKDLSAVHQPLPGVGEPTVQLYTGHLLFCPRRRQRAVVGNHDGESLAASASRAEDHSAPRPISLWDTWRYRDNCVGNEERRGKPSCCTSTMMHPTRETVTAA